MIRPGEICLADLLDAGRRPVLVVSRESLNRGKYVSVVTFTSGRFNERRHLPNCVPFKAGEFGITIDCVAQCESLASVPIQQLDLGTGPLGMLDEPTLRNVIKSIGFVIESDCEPE